MNINNSFIIKICKWHDKDTKNTTDSGDKEMAFIYTNRETVNKGMAHEMGHKWRLEQFYNRNHSREENTQVQKQSWKEMELV